MFLKTLLLLFLLFSSVYGSKNIYFKYSEIPERVYKGQIFSITVKTTVLTENFDDIRYKFIGGRGVKQQNFEPEREMVDEDGIISVYDKFYFKAISTSIVIPRINLYANSPANKGLVTYLSGKVITSIEIPPSKDFSNIFADKLEIYKILANQYDKTHNILTMFIRGEVSDLESIYFNELFISKQAIQTGRSGSFLKGELVYYVVVPKYYDRFIFKYFNTQDAKLQTIENPIDVRDDMVTTAKDLRPKIIDKNKKIKIGISAGFILIFLILFYFYRHYTNLILASFGLIITISFIFPKPDVCVVKGSVVRILPMLPSTTFKSVDEKTIFEKIAEKGDFIKIRLSESSEGWIKVEDVCKN